VAVNSLTSCGDAEKLDITLRNRDGFGDPPTGCAFWRDELHAETTTECVAAALERPDRLLLVED
jgi:hypothetical protein